MSARTAILGTGAYEFCGTYRRRHFYADRDGEHGETAASGEPCKAAAIASRIMIGRCKAANANIDFCKKLEMETHTRVSRILNAARGRNREKETASTDIVCYPASLRLAGIVSDTRSSKFLRYYTHTPLGLSELICHALRCCVA